MSKEKYDFSGWVTRFGIKCSDGRVITKDAFKECDGKTVPLVWNHQHNSVDNVLGNVYLEHRAEGMYGYGAFNDSDPGHYGKALVDHGDIVAMSIYANQLNQSGCNVMHGAIREVSLVLAGANPGAYIDTVISHSADGIDVIDEGIIYNGYSISVPNADKLEHAEEKEMKDEMTVEEVFNSMSEKQKNCIYAMIAMATGKASVPKSGESVAHADDGGETIKDIFNTLTDDQKTVAYFLIGEAIKDSKSNTDNGGNKEMGHNVFDQNELNDGTALSHAEMMAFQKDVINDAENYGSFKKAYLAHAVTDANDNEVTYGIANMEYLFPEDRLANKEPIFIQRDNGWVAKVMNGVHHAPFARIKSLFADITMDEARAKGYIKGKQKKDEVFSLLKRSTTPQTIYKRQKFDRDDLIDITDFDVVAWVKKEMRMMLDEEIARAILIGDGRPSGSDDKIDPTHIRPIWTDADLYTIKAKIVGESTDTDDSVAKKFIRACRKARKTYKGSGNPVVYTTEDVITDCLLMEDTTGRIIYDTEEKLRTALRVSAIVTVPVMENLKRYDSTGSYELMAILVNLADYTVGADKGGAVALFDDFDIDVNRYIYLIETRCSGALMKPYSAIAVEYFTAGETDPNADEDGN